MISNFSVTTANTLLGRASRDISCLGVEILQSDILLLQEVISPQRDNLKAQLEKAGFILVAGEGKYGLAVAIRLDSELKLVDGSTRSIGFEKLSWLERFLLKILVKQAHEFTERGMLAVKLKTKNGDQLIVVNVHPGISFASKRMRNRQIEALSKELRDHYNNGALIVAGDMNHYPGPGAIDKQLQQTCKLSSVDLNGAPTWTVRGSHYEVFARVATIFSRRSLDSYDGQLDAILYRSAHLKHVKSTTIPIDSDHLAIKSTFKAIQNKAK